MKRTPLRNLVADAASGKPVTHQAASHSLTEKPVKDFKPNHSPKRAPSRIGKKSVQLFITPEEHKRVKKLVVDEDMSIEAFIKLALNRELELRNLPPIELD